MKAASLLLLTFFLFSICSIQSRLTFRSADGQETAPEPVLDTEGNEMHRGNAYHILPAVSDWGGGLHWTLLGPESCPYSIVQEPSELSDGNTFLFRPADPAQSVIRVSTDLNIRFTAVPRICIQTVWKVNDYDKATGKYFVTTGGTEGKPGLNTLSSWFKIERDGEDYRLFFCPTVCSICNVTCKDLGIYSDEQGLRRLALPNDSPLPFNFLVKFKKAGFTSGGNETSGSA